MTKAGKIARRSLLVGSVAVAGGVAFGAWQVLRRPANPLHPKGATTLNPWLIIARDEIVVIVPRAEMGQGVQTTLAALVAEELDADLATIRVEHGPPAQAYFNAALTADRSYANSDKAPASGWAAVLAQGVPKILSLQVTGGSTSTIDAFYKMRYAGATARLALLEAAAARLAIDREQITTEPGFVVAPDGRRLAYGALAEAASTFTPAQNPLLKPRTQWRLLGKSQPRLDLPAKGTGATIFGMDVRLEGMKFASLRRNPRLGGTMRSFDASGAENMAGVEKIVDLGDGVAVIANNTWLAMRAVNTIEIEWGEAPYPPETKGIFAKIEAAFDHRSNIVARDDGDISSMGKDIFTASYQAPFLAHATMEVMNSTALFSGDALEIWSPNQFPTQARKEAARAVGLSTKNVTLHTTLMGGGFGRRANVEYAALAARIAREMPGVAVQTTWSREEDMGHDYYRPGALARLRAGLVDGKPHSLEARLAAPSILAQNLKAQLGLPLSPADATLTEGLADQPYAIENFHVTGHAADLAVPVGFWRSVGNSQNAFFMESFIDELAHNTGADPLEFRLELIRPKHEVSAKVIENVREISGWHRPAAPGIGRGIAFTYSFGSPVAEVVEVVEQDGKIRISEVFIAADLGMVLDPRNVEAQLTGGASFGLSAAIFGAITFANGAVEQQNFPDYDALRMHTAPRFSVIMSEHNQHIGGAGEIATPPAAPALANALFDLTGQRARSLPLKKFFDFHT